MVILSRISFFFSSERASSVEKDCTFSELTPNEAGEVKAILSCFCCEENKSNTESTNDEDAKAMSDVVANNSSITYFV